MNLRNLFFSTDSYFPQEFWESKGNVLNDKDYQNITTLVTPKESTPTGIQYSISTPTFNLSDYKLKTHIDDHFKTKPKSFKELLFGHIDAKGYKNDAELYKKAGIDRRHFSKIKSKPKYTPQKTTIYVFALALELDMSQTTELLSSAGYSFSNYYKDDIIIKYCIEHSVFNIFNVNSVLEHFDQKPLLF